MKRLITAAMLVVVPALAGADDKPTKEEAAKAAKQLDGSYELVAAIRAGKAGPKVAEVTTFTIKDGAITVVTDSREEKAKFTVDPTKRPAHIDIVTGTDAVRGIYEVKETDKGFELTIAFAKGIGAAFRPTDFRGEGSDETVLKLVRKKAK